MWTETVELMPQNLSMLMDVVTQRFSHPGQGDIRPPLITRQIKDKPTATRMGFEPTRAEHNGLAVHRLNHSATSSYLKGF